ncbi:MAG: VTT domain-containing protein [Gammaproteobacteria bacterium]
MLQNIVHPFVQWVTLHPIWGIAATFAIAFCETLAFVGYTVPAVFLLFGVGTLIGSGLLPFWPVFAAGVSGAFLGDGSSYLLGRFFRGHGSRFIEHRGIRTNLARGQRFFQNHGGKSIIMGRMIGPLRPIVPIVSGLSDFPLLRFISIDILACLIWAPLYLLPGMVFGASVDLAAAVSLKLAILLLLSVATCWVFMALLRRGLHLLAPLENRLLKLWLKVWEGAPSWPKWNPLANQGEDQSGAPLLILVGLLLIGLLWLANRLILTFTGEPWPGFFDALGIEAASRMLTAPIEGAATLLVVWMTPAGWLLFGFATSLLLLARKSYAAVRYLLAAMLFGLICDLLLGTSFNHWSTGFLYPNSIAGALAVYGVGAGMGASGIPKRHRFWFYLGFAVPILISILASLLIGTLWLGNALGTGLLGFIWAILLVMAFRHHPHLEPPRKSLLVLFWITLAAVVPISIWTHFALPERLVVRLPRAVWLKGNWPKLHPSRKVAHTMPSGFNVEYAGRLAPLKHDLLEAGWRAPLPLTPETALSWLLTHPPVTHLPLFPSLHHGRFPALALLDSVAVRSHRKSEWVLRLWQSSYVLEPGRIRLWIGEVSHFTSTEHLSLMTLPHNQGIPQHGIVLLEQALLHHSNYHLKIRSIQHQPVLFIEYRKQIAKDG